jgi:NADPH:quinone reductase-like Zn-dependent oxidoreductase
MTQTVALPIPKTAHAIRVHAFGGNDQLKYEEVEVPTPGEGEVLLRVAAAGVNPVDWKVVRGYLNSAIPAKMPFVPGWELSGTIVARGHGARRFAVGDRVYGYVRRPSIEHGAYAEYVSAPECYLAAAPEKLPLEAAAGIPLAGLTAYQCIHDAAKLREDETILILGASGGVGGFGIQIAKVLGANVIAVASQANSAYVLGLGADEFIGYDKGPVEAAFKAHAGKADVIFDCTGGDTSLKSRPVLKDGGRVVSIAARNPPAGFEGVNYQYVFVDPSCVQLRKLAGLADEGRLTVHVHARTPLSQAAKALDQSETGHTRGKVVLVPG